MTKRIKILVSACLLGEKVRYDGGHKRDLFLNETLGPFVEWVRVCPEVDCGLPGPARGDATVGDPKHPGHEQDRDRPRDGWSGGRRRGLSA